MAVKARSWARSSVRYWMAVISNGLTILNVDPYWQSIIIGTIIIVAVMISSYQKR